jgi:predicted metal-dependent peptidase
MSKQDTLSKAGKELMLKEPYYGIFLIMLNKLWTNRVPTAGVSKNGINYQLAINEDFWTKLSSDHHIGLLKHELLHIAFGHLTSFTDFPDKKLANIAMDMEINQYIDPQYLPDGGINIDDYPELNLNRKAGCRYYYDKLKQAKEDKKQNGTCGSGNMDKLLEGIEEGAGSVMIQGGGSGEKEVELPDHGTWEEFENLPEAEQKLIEKQLQKLLTDAKEQTLKKRGNIPGEIEDLIQVEKITPPKFDWRGYLRRFTGISSKVFTKKIRRKENRRYTDNPGLKVKMKQHMLLGIDTSGSVSDDELREFMNEIHHIYKCGVDVTIIQCDTSIRSIEPYKPHEEFKVYGRGGTEFDPVLEYYNAHLNKYTSLVYFTDGECYTSVKPKGKVLWILSEQSYMNEDLPGQVIKLEL